MPNTIPFNNGERQPDGPHGERAAPSANTSGEEQLRQEYTNEEVSEIIRVALKSADDGDQSIVNQEEMLTIAGEFGLSAADLVRASEAIIASREKSERASKVRQKAMQGFWISVVGYAALIIGLFFLNWAISPGDWWFYIPAIAIGPVVGVYGFIVKYYPDLAVKLVREEKDVSN